MTRSPKRSPKHLSDTALIVLGRAADSENQMLLPIPKSVRAHGKAHERAMQSLLRQGFVEEVPVGLDDEAWRSITVAASACGLRAWGSRRPVYRR